MEFEMLPFKQIAQLDSLVTMQILDSTIYNIRDSLLAARSLYLSKTDNIDLSDVVQAVKRWRLIGDMESGYFYIPNETIVKYVVKFSAQNDRMLYATKYNNVLFYGNGKSYTVIDFAESGVMFGSHNMTKEFELRKGAYKIDHSWCGDLYYQVYALL